LRRAGKCAGITTVSYVSAYRGRLGHDDRIPLEQGSGCDSFERAFHNRGARVRESRQPGHGLSLTSILKKSYVPEGVITAIIDSMAGDQDRAEAQRRLRSVGHGKPATRSMRAVERRERKS